MAASILSLAIDEVTLKVKGGHMLEGIDVYAGEEGVTLIGPRSNLEEFAVTYFAGWSEVLEFVDFDL
jgi:hypothetical protein